jgi:hypothetical protein
MAHFAELDQNNVVTQVIVVGNDTIDNLPFPESESVGVAFCQSLLGAETRWAQTSYNANFRYNYAGIGYTFDPAPAPNGAFIPPKPYPSWLLDTNTFQWQPPVPYPTDGGVYTWDEDTQTWVPVPPSE